MFYFNKVVEDNMSRTELEHVVKVSVVLNSSFGLFRLFSVVLPK